MAVFDPVAAPSLGVRPGRVELALLALLAIAVVAAVLSLGNLLVFALLVAPAAAAMRLGHSVRAQLWLAAGLGAARGVLGLVVSSELDVAAGGSVALAAVVLYALAALMRPAAGAQRRAAALAGGGAWRAAVRRPRAPPSLGRGRLRGRRRAVDPQPAGSAMRGPATRHPRPGRRGS